MPEPGAPTPAAEIEVRRRPSSRKIMLWIVVAILLGMFLPPLINVNRFRSRIASSIGSAVGRPATVGGVELRLLPQPGFDLHNVEIADDPSISPEYLLRADAVTAYLRLSSLWRGRLEIARLSLTDPSLNVVRSDDGRWNLETLLSRTTQIPSAPTAQAHPESARRRFPYIEATGGRINFKFGLEKKAFTFTEADFALWLAAENTWNMRLDARPTRVDTKVTDTGSIRMEGSFERNSELRYTPVKLTVDWRDGQLGQVSKLLTGLDHGWRGGTTFNLTATGTPANLVIVTELRVDDFRRYDIFSNRPMRVATHCVARYLSPEEKFADVNCQSPIEKGTLELRGTVQRLRAPFFDLSLTGRNVGLGSFMSFVHHAKRDLPDDLSAAGTADFAFTARKALDPGAKSLWSGSGTTTGVVLRSQALGPDLAIGPQTFVVAPEVPDKSKRSHVKSAQPPVPQEVDRFRLAVAEFPLPLGAAAPTSAQAVITEEGVNVSVAGDADIERALQVTRALGIDTPKVSAKGPAKVELQVTGHWTGFEAPDVTGTVQMKNVVAEIPGIIEPVQLAAAVATIDEKTFAVQSFTAAFVKGPNLTGTLAIPRNCSTAPCPVQFTVHADELSPERLNQLLNPKFRSRPWYNFFTPQPAKDGNPLATLEASGQFSVDRWNLQGTLATHVSGAANINQERVALADLKADVLGGQHTGDWDADFTGDRPVYNGKGKLTHANLALLSTAMQDAWATGTADVSYQVKMTGRTPDELRSSASGLGDLSVKDGALRHIALDGKTGPLKITRLDGTLELRDGNFVLNDAKLQSGAAVYTVQGTASWTRQLKFKLTHSQRAYAITGTIARPEVKAEPVTEAASQPKP